LEKRISNLKINKGKGGAERSEICEANPYKE